MRKSNIIKTVLFTALGLCMSATMAAEEIFTLFNRDGHYFITTPIFNTTAEVMVESGIPALLVGSDFYDSAKKATGLEFMPSDKKIRLLNNVYDISYQAKGTVNVANVLYDGPIFILEGYEGISMPVQYLKSKSGERVITVDFQDAYMLVGSPVYEPKGTAYKLSRDNTTGFPTVNISAKMTTAQGRPKLKGDCIIDFGNPSLLFLMRQDKSLSKAIRKGKVELKDAYNSRGQLVAQGIYAETVTLLGKEYHEVSIGVTDKMQAIKQMGFLGVKFFDSPVTFDFDKGEMTIIEEMPVNYF